MRPTARLGVDIGGTFTDLVLLTAGGAIFSAKVSGFWMMPNCSGPKVSQ